MSVAVKRAGSAAESQVQHPSSCDREALVPGENALHGVRRKQEGTGKRDTLGIRQSTGRQQGWWPLSPTFSTTFPSERRVWLRGADVKSCLSVSPVGSPWGHLWCYCLCMTSLWYCMSFTGNFPIKCFPTAAHTVLGARTTL